MPDFSLASIPGLEGNVTIAENVSGVPLQVGLKDAVLFLPGQQRLPLTASHQRNATGAHVLTLTGTFTPPNRLLAGQLLLEALTLTLRFRAGSGGALVLDTGAPGAVVAAGQATWSGAHVLGMQNGLPLQLSYRLNSGGTSGFVLALTNPPIPVPGGLAEIRSGEISAELPADRPVIAITLRGEAALTASGRSNINQLLTQVFPGAPQIQPLGFMVRQEFSLANGAIPPSPQPASVPFFRFDFDWPQGNLPSLPNLPAALRLDMGKPSFSFPLGGGAAPAWSFHLPQTGIRFPDLAGLAPFQLLGTLHLDTGAVNRLSFEPSGPGGFDLPDPLKFLLSRLGWSGGRTPLDEIEQTAQRSVAEFEWQDLFTNLIPSPLPSAGLDLAALGAQLEQALVSAIQTSGLELPRIFFTAMQGLQGGGRDAYRVLWQKWFSPAVAVPNPLDQLPGLLISMTGMAADAFEASVKALFDTMTDLGGFASSWLKVWAAAIDTQFDQFLLALTRTLRVALPSLPRAKLNLLGAGMMDAVIRLPELQPILTLPAIPSLGGLQLPAMALGDGLLAATFAELTASRPGGPVTITGLFDGLFSATESNDAVKAQRAKDALVNASTPESTHRDFLLRAIGKAAVSHLMPWWDLVDRPVNPEANPPRNLLTLPAGKYLIVSDVHRDRKSDSQGAFRFDSISHFQANRDIYAKVIDWAKAKNYTLIEGGDCEELWFLRKPSDSDRNKILRDIITDNQVIYDKLRELHHTPARPGDPQSPQRYYRIYGNHDSQLREICAQTLKNEMERPFGSLPVRPFHVYDFIIIDGVKSMVEHAALDKALQMAAGLSRGESVEQIAAALAKGTVGMDAEDYQTRCRMLITHGHQWDFYNCDPNNIIGMFIAQQVAVRVDKAMDPLLAVRGIALGGNPLIDFGEILSAMPIASCWPSEADAVRLAHQIQHMANDDRKLVDSVLYKESLTAITGTFGIALNAPGPPGAPEITPEQSRRTVNPNNPQSVLDYLDKHHNHHICIGHTHNPHSQPFFALKSVLSGLPYLGNIFQLLPSVLPGNPNLFKSKYFNSGTAGWWEGVIWAVQIDETQQARLVYWTQTTTEPQVMDWELTKWKDKAQFPKTKEDLQRMLEDFLANVIGLDSMTELWKSVGRAPIELLKGAVAKGRATVAAVETTLAETLGSAEEAVEEFQQWASQLQTDMIELLLTLRSRASGFRNTAQDTFSITVNIAEGVSRQLKDDMARIIGEGPNATAQALHAACIAYPLLEQYPRNLALAAMANPSLHPERFLLDSFSPVFALFSSFVSFFPPAGRLARVGDQAITSTLSFTGANDLALKFTVTMQPIGGRPTDPNV